MVDAYDADGNFLGQVSAGKAGQKRDYEGDDNYKGGDKGGKGDTKNKECWNCGKF